MEVESSTSLTAFKLMFSKHCRHTVDIFEMCMWIFDRARINVDKITVF